MPFSSIQMELAASRCLSLTIVIQPWSHNQKKGNLRRRHLLFLCYPVHPLLDFCLHRPAASCQAKQHAALDIHFLLMCRALIASGELPAYFLPVVSPPVPTQSYSFKVSCWVVSEQLPFSSTQTKVSEGQKTRVSCIFPVIICHLTYKGWCWKVDTNY